MQRNSKYSALRMDGTALLAVWHAVRKQTFPRANKRRMLGLVHSRLLSPWRGGFRGGPKTKRPPSGVGARRPSYFSRHFFCFPSACRTMNHQVSEEHQHHQQQGLLQTGEGKVLTSIRGRRRGKRRASSEVARGLDGGEEVKEVKEEEEEKEEKTGGQKQEEEEEEEEEITTTTNGRRRKRAPKDWEKVRSPPQCCSCS